MTNAWQQFKVAAEEAMAAQDLSRAETMWYAALEEAEKFTLEDPRLLFTLDNLADTMCARGRYVIAEPLYLRSLSLKSKALGDTHLSVAKTLNALAGLYYSLGQYKDAEPRCRTALAIYEEHYGTEHINVGMTAGNLAMLLHSQEKYVEAQNLYRKALTVRTKMLGHDHPDVIRLRNSYSTMLSRTKLGQGDNREDQVKTWTLPVIDVGQELHKKPAENEEAEKLAQQQRQTPRAMPIQAQTASRDFIKRAADVSHYKIKPVPRSEELHNTDGDL